MKRAEEGALRGAGVIDAMPLFAVVAHVSSEMCLLSLQGHCFFHSMYSNLFNLHFCCTCSLKSHYISGLLEDAYNNEIKESSQFLSCYTFCLAKIACLGRAHRGHGCVIYIYIRCVLPRHAILAMELNYYTIYSYEIQ